MITITAYPKAIFAALILLSVRATLCGQNYADAGAGYSATQGSNNWWYGYYDRSGDLTPGYDPTNDFQQCTIFTNSEWHVPGGFVTSLGAASGHPSGATNTPGFALGEQWAIRRWVSTVADTVRVHGHISKFSTGCGGDGPTTEILVNGRTVYGHAVAPNDGVGFDYSIGVLLRTNDIVDFVITAGCCGDAACDGARFSATIDHANFSINVATAVEVGVPSIADARYQMQFSTDLQAWQSIGDVFVGTGDMMYFLFSSRQLGTPGYFRAQVVP